MKKILSLIAIIFLFSLNFVPLVSASYVCPAQYVGTTDNAYPLRDEHPSDIGYLSAYGEAFTANATCYLYNATFKLGRLGVAVTTVKAVLYATAGTVGSTAVPTGDALAVSFPVNCSTFALTPLTFTFIFDGTFQMQASTVYAIVVQADEGDFQATTYPNVYGRATDGDASMNSVNYKSSGWSAVASNDAYFIINGDSTEGAYATPTPTPTSSSSPSTGDEDIENLTAIILPWLVPLLVCLIPALLGYKFVGELGFFIGLNVGCILAFVTLEGTAYAFPLWGIILVGVMDVAVVLMRR